MSYVLHIWEQPVNVAMPANLVETDGLLSALRSQASGQNPLFHKLAKQLTKRFPCIRSRAAEDIPEDEWAWSDGPLNGVTESAVYSIGLNSNNLNEVLPFVAENAVALSLNVMDEQAGTVYLCDGKILGTPRPIEPPSPRGYPRTREFREFMFEGLAQFLAPMGYKANRRETLLVRKFKGGSHMLDVSFGENWLDECQSYGIVFYGRLDAVIEKLHDAVFSDRPWEEYKTTRGCMHFGVTPLLKKLHDWPYASAVPPIKTWDDAHSALEVLKADLRQHILPILEQCMTIEGFDKLLNTEAEASSIFDKSNKLSGTVPVITAYLAGNPRLEAICQAYLEEVLKFPKSDQGNETRRAIDFVRSHPRSQ